jgi:hypothetical protein
MDAEPPGRNTGGPAPDCGIVSHMHCEECGRPQQWTWEGITYEPHTDAHHRAWRQALYRQVWARLGRHVWKKATGE